LRERFEYVMRCYLPMVEEMTFGRRFLDVGFGLDFHLKNLTERGWVVEGIDLIENDFITGDFERHDFKDQTFDFIFMGRVLECFEDPLKAVYKARELLNENGVLMVISPDAELIYSGGMWDFGNWNFKEVGMIFSERQIKKVMDQMGFNVVMSRKDRGKRFVGWNMFHLIAQKRVLSGDQ
jgi:ubiquinone/menaquinone biosynthesis C-methylase UbiE